MKTLAFPLKPRRKRLSQITAESDEAILLRYCETQRREDFAQLVYRYERELFSYLRRYLGDAELAEDAFQATFLQVHLKCKYFESERRFRPWLYTIATHQAIDAQRRNKRHRMVSLDRSGTSDSEDVSQLLQLLVSQAPSPMAQVSTAERVNWLRGALEQLPEPMRLAVNLIYYQGMKYREAGEVLGIPTGTVKSRLHAAVLRLNELWNEHFQDQA
jgi:RNA polymerase sigma-70 factor (ECF subfamily)